MLNMLTVDLTYYLEEALSQALLGRVSIRHQHRLRGGCIHESYCLETDHGHWFVKWNDIGHSRHFKTEAQGLQLLAATGEIHVPRVITLGETPEHAYVIMEYIAAAPRKWNYWEHFGQSLAALHRHSQPAFGLDHDNFIGALPQSNQEHRQWVTFFVEERLQKQVELALKNRYLDRSYLAKFDKLYSRLPDILPVESPSLLHGDLWSGNVMINERGEVSLIDPAVYYGHREAEIAFSQLFGAYPAVFYEAYQEVYPLQSGWKDRVSLFNLYPLLVHLNLFGPSYLPQIRHILKQFSA